MAHKSLPTTNYLPTEAFLTSGASAKEVAKVGLLQPKKGFTLIEILVTVSIIGLISIIAIKTYTQFTKQSRDAKRISDIQQIKASLEMYWIDNGVYPTPCPTAVCPSGLLFGTGSLTGPNGKVYMSKVPQDPINTNNLKYEYSLQSSDLYVLGARKETAGFYALNSNNETCPVLNCDLNHDGTINSDDMTPVANCWGAVERGIYESCRQFDFNCDGDIGINDIQFVGGRCM